MKLRVLGCHGAELGGHNACGFLINESVLLDAGTVGRSLSLIEQSRIRYILLSHIHMDHIKGLSALSENRIPDNERNPVVIISLEEVLEGLERWVFNDQLWPNFTQLPSSRDPVFRLQPLKEGASIEIEGLEIKAFSVNHIVPCAGFVVRQNNASFLYSGDTGETDQLWKAAAADPTLKAAFIETTFPNALEDLAIRSRHLTPRLLRQEFDKIGKPDLPVYAYHMKPRYLSTIKRELADLRIQNLSVLEDKSVIEFH
jgi:ribonuclease BN (tRNA processing enzyme)